MLRILPSAVPFSSPRCVGPHDGNEHIPSAIASDGVQSVQPCGPAGLVYSFLTGIRSWNERSKESTLGVNQGKQVEVTLAFL
jgi:hypothetical protein